MTVFYRKVAQINAKYFNNFEDLVKFTKKIYIYHLKQLILHIIKYFNNYCIVTQ